MCILDIFFPLVLKTLNLNRTKNPQNIFNIKKKVYFAHQGCIYLIKNAVKTIQLWNIIAICFYFNILKNWMYSCDAMLNFQQPFELKYTCNTLKSVFECFLSISLQQVKLQKQHFQTDQCMNNQWFCL